jgi:hypothetical protein
LRDMILAFFENINAHLGDAVQSLKSFRG